MAAFIVLVNNDNVVELNGLRNPVTGEFLNAATVDITITDPDGVEVTGETWPLTIPYVAASNGIYRVILDKVIDFIAGVRYTAVINAAESGLDAKWTLTYLAQVRDSSD